jgi:hypothetical protein
MFSADRVRFHVIYSRNATLRSDVSVTAQVPKYLLVFYSHSMYEFRFYPVPKLPGLDRDLTGIGTPQSRDLGIGKKAGIPGLETLLDYY